MAEKSKNGIAHRLLIGFSSIILLLIAFGVISLIEIRTLSKVTRTIYNHPLVVSNASLAATVSMIKMHRSLKDVAFFDFPSEINTAINTVNEQERLVLKSLDTVKKNILGDEGKKLENETRRLFVTWKPIREEVIKLVSNGQREAAAKITMGKGADHVAKLETKMLELTSYARNKADGFIRDGEKVRSRVMKTTIILISIGLFLSVFIALFTIRRTKSVEEALRESEEQYRILIEAASQSGQAITMQQDRDGIEAVCVFSNDAAVSLTGYTRDELSKLSWMEIVHPHYKDEAADRYRRRMHGEEIAELVPIQIIRKNGTEITIELTSILATFKGIKTLVTLSRNITDRKQAEEAIHRSKILLESSIESPKDMIILSLDREYRYLYFNKTHAESMSHVYGARPQIGDCIFDNMKNKDDIEQVKEHYDRALAGEGHVTTEEYGEGQVRYYYEIRYNPVYDEKNEIIGVTAFAQNITERNRAEEALRESEERYRILIEAADRSGQAVIVHQKKNEEEAICVFSNHTAVKITGYEQEELSTLSWFNILHPDYRDGAKARYKKRMDGEDIPGIFVLSIIRKDGSEVLVEGSSIRTEFQDKSALVTFFRDISERKNAEEALQAGEERYRRLIELNPDGIYVSRKGKIIYVNQATIDIWGAKSEDELIGKTIFDLIHPDFRETAKQRYRLMTEQGISVPLIDFLFLRLDGGETHVQAIASPVIFRGETAILTAVRDITEQKRAEAEKGRLESQLQQAQKMESIGTLAGGIAHDFNNILSPIMIHSEMAMMDLPAESPLQKSVKQIYKAGERARDLVKQILTFARMGGDNKAPISITLILKEAIKLLRSTIPTTIDIQYGIETEQDTVLADPTQINQIVMNLCTNAAYAMREKGGVLELILAAEHINKDYVNRFGDLNPGHYLRLSIRDTGSGIDPEIIDRIFEPYFTTKGPGEGTGMGLALIHGIVKSYGGDIAVASERGKGTTFHVMLPIVEAEVSPAIEQKTEFPGGSERILLVDDEKVAVDAIQSMLTNLGYKVTARTSSIEALEAFRNNPDAFDLIITDMTMPNMTGRELAKEIMSIRKDIPIILCTGFSDQIDEKKAKALGMRAFVMKPIVMREMANTIRNLLDKK